MGFRPQAAGFYCCHVCSYTKAAFGALETAAVEDSGCRPIDDVIAGWAQVTNAFRGPRCEIAAGCGPWHGMWDKKVTDNHVLHAGMAVLHTKDRVRRKRTRQSEGIST